VMPSSATAVRGSPPKTAFIRTSGSQAPTLGLELNKEALGFPLEPKGHCSHGSDSRGA
jgi:hypothetical protein